MPIAHPTLKRENKTDRSTKPCSNCGRLDGRRWGTFASRSLVIAGGACKLAAATLRDRLQAVAGQILEADASDIEIADGRAFVAVSRTVSAWAIE